MAEIRQRAAALLEGFTRGNTLLNRAAQPDQTRGPPHVRGQSSSAGEPSASLGAVLIAETHIDIGTVSRCCQASEKPLLAQPASERR